MTGGEQPRKRGRPKGSKNRRAADLKGFIDARYGGSAALQMAQLAMVTQKELAAAGGSMGKAVVAKAAELVEHVRQVQDERDERLRHLVREALEEALGLAAAGVEIRKAVLGIVTRVREGTSGFGLAQALKMLADERAALLPYTDQRQPQAVTVNGDQLRPSVVIMGASGPAPMLDVVNVENIGDFQPIEGEVSRAKSHDESQGVEQPRLFGPDATD